MFAIHPGSGSGITLISIRGKFRGGTLFLDCPTESENPADEPARPSRFPRHLLVGISTDAAAALWTPIECTRRDDASRDFACELSIKSRLDTKACAIHPSALKPV
jgi:hypothetical protein